MTTIIQQFFGRLCHGEGRLPGVRIAMMAMLAVAVLCMAPDAYAGGGGGGGGGGNANANCTDEFPQAQNSEGILTQIVDYIKEIIMQATQDLFQGIVGHPSFINALNAAFAIFVTLYGVMFMFGIVPLSLGQASVRLFKFGVILSVVNVGSGFGFFSNTAIRFFNDGTDELISALISIATGDSSGTSYSASGSPQPFRQLDGIVQEILSSKMMVSIIGSFLNGPSGLMMGGLLTIGIIAFVQTIIKALKIYCLSLIAKALLFGLAPIFFGFMLFERTKNMFMGWVNQVVNFSLQPLLMFAFISFFIILLQSSAENILGVAWCWTAMDVKVGSPISTHWWRPKEFGTTDWTPLGPANCLKGGGSNCPDFPISVVDTLAFLILAHLAYRFSDVVQSIATEIASSTLILDRIKGGMGDYFRGDKGGTTKRPGN